MRPFASPILDANTLAAYGLGERGVATDLMGTYPLTASGTPTWSDDGVGVVNNASFLYNNSLQLAGQGGSLTAEAWFRPDALPANFAVRGILGNNDGSTGSLRLFMYQTGGVPYLYGEWTNSAGTVYQAIYANWGGVVGTWYHVACTFVRNSAVRLWLNGVEVGTPVIVVADVDLRSKTTVRVGTTATAAVGMTGMVGMAAFHKTIRYATGSTYRLSRWTEGRRLLARGPGDFIAPAGVMV